MCGIFAFVDTSPAKNAAKNVVEGLKNLEYRGYDSAGIAFVNGEKMQIVRSIGAVKILAEKVAAANDLSSTVAVGHTRWATHGAVTENNSHPHTSADGRVAVVHNGIIENYRELRETLARENVKFTSETDTEVIPNLVSRELVFAENDGKFLLSAVQNAAKKLKGSYAFLAISPEFSDTIIAAKNGSQPLVIGRERSGAVFLSSDIPTATRHAAALFALDDGEFACIQGDRITFYTENGSIEKTQLEIKNKQGQVSRGRFKTFMEKEIFEIPDVISNLETEYKKIDLSPAAARIRAASAVHIVACGTSFHAGLYIASLLEAAQVRAKSYVASEFLCTDPFIANGDIAMVISQSGETADTLLAMKKLKSRSIFTIAICNVEHSSIWRYADKVLPSFAGAEVAVASTKAFLAQSLVGEILAAAVSGESVNFQSAKNEIKQILKLAPKIRAKVDEYKGAEKIFFLGKGVGSIIALESALKVKEITYRHCEGISAGELKHGTLALVDEKTLSIVITPPQPEIAAKMANSVAEVASRSGKIWALPPAGGVNAVAYAQLFALYLSESLALDPDKPRNLAKSVTVD